MLADYRRTAPQLQQTIFRIGTILGETVANQITALFDKPRPLAVAGSTALRLHLGPGRRRRDPARAGRRAAGIYNVAGDGALTIHEIAARMGKRCRVCRRRCCKRRCGSANGSA